MRGREAGRAGPEGSQLREGWAQAERRQPSRGQQRPGTELTQQLLGHTAVGRLGVQAQDRPGTHRTRQLPGLHIPTQTKGATAQDAGHRS